MKNLSDRHGILLQTNFQHDIINAVVGATGQVNELDSGRDQAVQQALHEFETGKFRALFDDVGVTGTADDYTLSTVSFVLDSSQAPIQEVRHSRPTSTLACGGNYQNPHC